MKILPFLLTLLFILGCAKDTRPPIVFAPTNPDLPAVIEPVKGAKATAAKAGDSARRAVQIVERMVPSPGQEATIQALRLELTTTVEELRLTGVQLDDALIKAEQLRKSIETMREWGIAQQARAAAAEIQVRAERDRADREHAKARKIARERDLFVNLFAVSLTVCGLILLAPLIRGFSAAAGAWAPAASVGLFLASAAGLYLGSFWLIRLILSLIV